MVSNILFSLLIEVCYNLLPRGEPTIYNPDDGMRYLFPTDQLVAVNEHARYYLVYSNLREKYREDVSVSPRPPYPPPRTQIDPVNINSFERRQFEVARIIEHAISSVPFESRPHLFVPTVEKFCKVLSNPVYSTQDQVCFIDLVHPTYSCSYSDFSQTMPLRY